MHCYTFCMARTTVSSHSSVVNIVPSRRVCWSLRCYRIVACNYLSISSILYLISIELEGSVFCTWTGKKSHRNTLSTTYIKSLVTNIERIHESSLSTITVTHTCANVSCLRSSRVPWASNQSFTGIAGTVHRTQHHREPQLRELRQENNSVRLVLIRWILS